MAKKKQSDKDRPKFDFLYGEEERNLNRQTQEELGITNVTLAQQLKDALEAKEPRIIKAKGAVDPKKLPPGFTVIATTGVIYYDRKGNEVYGDGETIIQYTVALQGIREGARKDVEAQRDHYPDGKTMQHSGEVTLKVVYDDKHPNGKEQD